MLHVWDQACIKWALLGAGLASLLPWCCALNCLRLRDLWTWHREGKDPSVFSLVPSSVAGWRGRWCSLPRETGFPLKEDVDWEWVGRCKQRWGGGLSRLTTETRPESVTYDKAQGKGHSVLFFRSERKSAFVFCLSWEEEILYEAWALTNLFSLLVQQGGEKVPPAPSPLVFLCKAENSGPEDSSALCMAPLSLFLNLYHFLCGKCHMYFVKYAMST